MTLCLSKNEMCTCLVALETFVSDLSVWQGRWGKNVSGEEHTWVQLGFCMKVT